MTFKNCQSLNCILVNYMILDTTILHFKKDYNIINRRKVKKKKGHYLLGARVRHSARGKGHEDGGSTYAKAGSSLRSPLEILEHLPP